MVGSSEPENNADDHAIFLYVSAAGSCRQVPELLCRLAASGRTVYSVLTPNVAMVTDPLALMDVPGNHWIRGYGHAPLERFPFGTHVVAPCTFNTLNKLALGIADNLATAMLGDALGSGLRIVIAPGMNSGQWRNPRVRESIQWLARAGCEFVQPVADGERLRLATMVSIASAVLAHGTGSIR